MKPIHIPGIAFFLIFASCADDEKPVTQFHELPFFREVELNSPFDVFLTEGDVFYIEISGAKERVKNIAFSVVDSVLRIRNESSAQWTSPQKNKIELVIGSLPLETVIAEQTCNIQTINPITSPSFGLILKSKANEATLELDCRSFYYWNNFPCGGMVRLYGRTDRLWILNVALMTIDARDLTSGVARIENASKGNCLVTVQNRLDYGISGPGSIHLYGSPPEINVIEITGTGKLIHH